MAFDRASEVYAARRFPSRPLRFLVDLPVVEAVGNGDEIEATLPRVREMLAPGLTHLAEVDLHAPRPQWVLPFTREPSRDVLWSWPSQSPLLWPPNTSWHKRCAKYDKTCAEWQIPSPL